MTAVRPTRLPEARVVRQRLVVAQPDPRRGSISRFVFWNDRTRRPHDRHEAEDHDQHDGRGDERPAGDVVGAQRSRRTSTRRPPTPVPPGRRSTARTACPAPPAARLAGQHGHQRLPQERRDLRVLRDLRPRLRDVRQVLGERADARVLLAELVEARHLLHARARGQVARRDASPSARSPATRGTSGSPRRRRRAPAPLSKITQLSGPAIVVCAPPASNDGMTCTP